MNIDNFNKAIHYIEENITNEIDYKKISKMVGISEQSFNRIFSFMTDTTITEYIRKRRLSRAYEELKSSNIKIIDLAMKYNYESDISFTRAFKKLFGITPSEARNSDNYIKLFPIAVIKENNNVKELKYKIIEINKDKNVYCFGVEEKNYDDYLYKIRKLYNRVKKLNIYEKMNDKGEMFGISVLENNKYKYFLGSETKFDNSIKIVVPKGKYVVFEIGSRNQNSIVEKYKSIYAEWIPATSYKVNMNFTFELYVQDNCFLYLTLI